jgi:hypothetical protein
MNPINVIGYVYLAYIIYRCGRALYDAGVVRR